jgi:hypothetical protein
MSGAADMTRLTVDDEAVLLPEVGSVENGPASIGIQDLTSVVGTHVTGAATSWIVAGVGIVAGVAFDIAVSVYTHTEGIHRGTGMGDTVVIVEVGVPTDDPLIKNLFVDLSGAWDIVTGKAVIHAQWLGCKGNSIRAAVFQRIPARGY